MNRRDCCKPLKSISNHRINRRKCMHFYFKSLCRPSAGMAKTLLVMKLIFILLTTAILQVSAVTYAQKITLQQTHAPLIIVLKEIRKQTGYDFFYSDKMMDNANLVTLHLKNADLKEALELCFKNQPLSYTVENKTVTIKPKEKSLLDQIIDRLKAIDISGRVVDERGLPLPGATVRLKKNTLTIAVITNKDGRFIFGNVDEHAILIVSYLGYLDKEISANADLQNIVLEMSNSRLDEVQIQAYGTTSHRLNTGNITSVKASEIEKQPVGNILLTLQGKVPGMSIIQNSGMPGAAPAVKIRGTNSISAGTSPLYILDGVPIPETQQSINPAVLGGAAMSGLEGINNADIESIEVLKDADATAIYGSRGANGVILITTKKGRAGGTSVNFSTYTGISRVQHYVDMLDIQQYNQMRREALANDGLTATATNSPDLISWDTTNVHNWQKELIGGTAATTDANVSVSGGSGGTTIYVNAGYHRQGTIFPGDADDVRKSIRLNANHVSQNGKFTAGVIAGYNTSTLNLQGQDLTSTIDMAPSYPLYTATGAPNFSGQRSYPLAYTMQPYNSQTKTYNGHANISYQPVKGLTIKLDAGLNNVISNQTLKTPLESLNPTLNTSGSLYTGNYQTNTWIAEPQITYARRLNKHSFNFLIGTSFQKTTASAMSGTGTNFANEALLGNLASAGTITIGQSDNEYAYTSLFSRLNYNYDEEYLANVSFRRDGSSRFGPDKRFGNFGAVGLGWIFTKERAVREALPFLSYGKIRGSYGINGNDQISDYGYLTTYNSSSNGYQGTTLAPASLANPTYRWEENRKLEAAVELGFFKDRIILSTSFFRNRTDNQLINYTLSPQTGFSSYQANFPALLQNQGWEFELNTVNLKQSALKWKTSVNVSFSHNKLLKFPGIEQTSYFSTYIVGQPITIVKGYVFNGLSATGVPVLADLNNDGSISSTADRIVLGNTDPLTGGLSNEFSYKNFDFSFFWDYLRLNSYDPAISAVRSGTIGTNRTVVVLDRWQKPGDELVTNTPKFTISSATYVARNYLQSDVNWKEANIFRLRNIAFSYNLPQQLMKKLTIQKAKIFFQGQNLWTSGDHNTVLDPETGYSSLPPLRTLTLGINCTF